MCSSDLFPSHDTNDGKVQMLGNFDENDWVTVTPYKTFSNGQVLKIDKMLQYSRRNTAPTEVEKYKSQDLITYILKMTAATQNPNVAVFKNYLIQCLKGDESNELAGISADMTLTLLTIIHTRNFAISKNCHIFDTNNTCHASHSNSAPGQVFAFYRLLVFKSLNTKANQTHYEVGKKVRQTIKEIGGTMPENLPTEESIKQIENKEKKKIGKKANEHRRNTHIPKLRRRHQNRCSPLKKPFK